MASRNFVKTSKSGAFVRETSKFRNWIEKRPDAAFPAEADRYHLYVSLACPWASRCVAAIHIKKLKSIIGLTVVHPVFQPTRPNDESDKHVGWAFADPKVTPALPGPSGVGSYSSNGSESDPIHNVQFIRDLYERIHDGPTRYTVPLLWDKKQDTIVSNESADILRMLNNAFENVLPPTMDLYPNNLQESIDQVNEWVYHDVSNGVYRSGFAQSQEAYDEAVKGVFNGLDRCEEILSKQRYLAGNRFTEADIRLFTTLIRFDEVYYVHFKCNRQLIAQYPNLSNYLRELYQMPPMQRSVNMDHIRKHYYASHAHMGINPFGVIPTGPHEDLLQPHDRDRFSDASPPTF